MQAQIVERWETQNEAGRRFFGKGDFARAEQAFVAAIREAEQLGAADLRLATSLANLAQLKLRQRNHDEADRLFRRSLQIRETTLGPDHASLVQTVNGLAAVCYARGDIDAAEPLFQRALSITERRLGAQHPDIVTSLNSLARIAFKRNDYAAAGPLLERLLVLKESTVGPDHPESAPILGSLVKVRCAEGALDEAERLARRVVAIRESEQPPAEITLASALELLADVLARLGKRDEERSVRQRATTLRGHPAATAGLMPLSTRHTPEAPDDVFTPNPTPSGLLPKREAATPRAPKREPAAPRGPSLGEHAFFLPDVAGTDIITPIPASPPRAPMPSPLSAMPRISMDESTDAVVTRRKTPPAAPPPLPEAPHAVEAPSSVEGAGQELVPIPAAPPPRPAPVAVAPPPVRPPAPRRSTPRRVHPPRPPRRRRTTGPRPSRGGGGRKIVIALVLLIAAGGAVVGLRRGGVTESRGATAEPVREFRAPPRKARRVASPVQRNVDSLAASVRDSVALLIGQPGGDRHSPTESPEVNVAAPLARTDPLARQIQQMLPTTREAEPDAPDPATRKDVKPTFNSSPANAPRP
jgi:Tfp pilus assembly protein PilF